LRPEVRELIYCTWIKVEMPQQWKESNIVPIHKKSDKTNRNNYREITLLSSANKSLSNILLARLTPRANENIDDHHCVFRRNRSTANQIPYIRQTLEKRWEYHYTGVRRGRAV
jgi:hypothetical protein